MTTKQWEALIRMTTSSSTNSYSSHYKGVPVEVSVDSMLTKVWIESNHDNVVPPMTFNKNSELLPLYRKVFKQVYGNWHSVVVDNLPF